MAKTVVYTALSRKFVMDRYLVVVVVVDVVVVVVFVFLGVAADPTVVPTVSVMDTTTGKH